MRLSCAIALFAVGCAEERWDEPSSDSPSVSVPLPTVLQDLRGISDNPFFGEASTDLSFAVVAQATGGTNRTLNLGYPGKAALQGYGQHAGETEVLRKSVMVDDYGIHTVRSATYRTDADGNHTNVWFSYLAKDTLGTIHATQIGIWDWINGDEELSSEQLGAWPMFNELNASREVMDRPLGLIPGRLDGKVTRTVIVSTDAVSPTSGVGDCSLYLFDSDDPALRYLAYVHERFGVVELVYRWELPNVFGDVSFLEHEELSPSIMPIDGFSLVRGSLSEPAPAGSTPSQLAGQWRTNFTEPDASSASSDSFEINVELSATGGHFDASRASHDVEGVVTHSRLGRFDIFGRYDQHTRRLSARSGGRLEELRIEGRFEPNLSEDELLRLHSVQVVEPETDAYVTWSGRIELLRTSLETTL